MTLDEAILHAEEVFHAEEVAKENLKSYKEWLACKNRGNAGWSKFDIESVDKSIEQCQKCAAEHKQLAEWLKDYKRLKDLNSKAHYCPRCGEKIEEKEIINENFVNAFEEFTKKLFKQRQSRGMTRFSNFTDEELDAMEWVFCNEGLPYISLIDEIRRERRYRREEKE